MKTSKRKKKEIPCILREVHTFESQNCPLEKKKLFDWKSFFSIYALKKA